MKIVHQRGARGSAGDANGKKALGRLKNVLAKGRLLATREKKFIRRQGRVGKLPQSQSKV